MHRVHLIPDEVGHIIALTAWLVDLPDFQSEDARHPVMQLRSRHSSETLHEAAKAIEGNFNGPGFCWIEAPVDAATADILRMSVERSDYATRLTEIAPDEVVDDLVDDSLDALRSLAFKLEEIGIEVSHLPRATDIDAVWSR